MICADKSITVFHYNRNETSRLHFGNVSVFKNVKVSISDINNASLSDIIIRIPTDEELCVDIGDKVVLRNADDGESVPYEETFSVISVKNNIRGSREVSHFCLICR